MPRSAFSGCAGGRNSTCCCPTLKAEQAAARGVWGVGQAVASFLPPACCFQLYGWPGWGEYPPKDQTTQSSKNKHFI